MNTFVRNLAGKLGYSYPVGHVVRKVYRRWFWWEWEVSYKTTLISSGSCLKMRDADNQSLLWARAHNFQINRGVMPQKDRPCR